MKTITLLATKAFVAGTAMFVGIYRFSHNTVADKFLSMVPVAMPSVRFFCLMSNVTCLAVKIRILKIR